jgi:hypothetical protein
MCTLTLGFGSMITVQAGCSECLKCFCATVSPYLKVAGEVITKEVMEAASAGLKYLQENKAQVFNDVLRLASGDVSGLSEDAIATAKASLKTLNMVNDDGTIKSNAKDIIGALVTSANAAHSGTEKASARSVESKEPVAAGYKVRTVKEALKAGTVKAVAVED